MVLQAPTETLRQILIVDDSTDDADLTREGFQRSPHDVELHHVLDGKECMKFLRKDGEYRKAPAPDLVLLDLNMPNMDGREVLAAIDKDPILRRLPVIVLTTSNAEMDRLTTYALGCNSYIVKPSTLESLEKFVRELCSYWFATVVLPPKI
ncbi:MAG: response regulator [Pirellulaceae bacterium]|nr:response regulator [Pirellulaceae bacterium]